MHIAALHGRDETVKFLVFKKANVTALTDVSRPNEFES
jgi:hypothetical protein